MFSRNPMKRHESLSENGKSHHEDTKNTKVHEEFEISLKADRLDLLQRLFFICITSS